MQRLLILIICFISSPLLAKEPDKRCQVLSDLFNPIGPVISTSKQECQRRCDSLKESAPKIVCYFNGELIFNGLKEPLKVCKTNAANKPPNYPISLKRCIWYLDSTLENLENEAVLWGETQLRDGKTHFQGERLEAPPKTCAPDLTIIGLVQPGIQKVGLVFFRDQRGWSGSLDAGPACQKKILDILASGFDVVFDRKVIGHIKTSSKIRTEGSGGYGRVVEVQSGLQSIPKKPVTYDEFGKLNRPYLTSSRSGFIDPANWKPALTFDTEMLRARIDKEFRNHIQLAIRVPNINDQKFDWDDFPSRLIEIEKVYRDKSERYLVKARFNANAAKKLNSLYENNDDGESNDWQPSKWFFIAKNMVRFVGTGLNLIDAGDFDQDGKSESIFFATCFRCDVPSGLLLYDDDFNLIADSQFQFELNRVK